MTTDDPSFAAIIGHADDADILAACIRHHLAIGVHSVFVSVNNDALDRPGLLDGDERVRAVRAQSFAEADNFLYLGQAMREAVAWAAPDWVLFADSDEMWLPESGRIAGTRGLSETDLFIVERYNSIPQLQADGAITAPDLAHPAAQLLVLAREFLDEAYLASDFRIPWIMGADAPKLLVRPGMVQQVGAGGHSIEAISAALRWKMPDDLVILHAPFTTPSRFIRKVAAVRAIMASHAARFDSRQAWHWRYWAALNDEQLPAEFRRQCIRAAAVPLLRRQAVVGYTTDLYPQLALRAAEFAGDALHEFLGRAMKSYQRP